MPSPSPVAIRSDDTKTTSRLDKDQIVIKYPRTAHLFDTGGSAITEDDLVVSEKSLGTTVLDAFRHSGRPVVVEEKVDGANLGIRVIDQNQLVVQNRSHYISSGEHAQFSMIQPWLQEHRLELLALLGSGKLILYGEWCVAKHSLHYDRLPGYFVAFDLFDIEANKFYSRPRFHLALQGSDIPVVPTIGVLAFGSSGESSADGATPTSRKGSKKSATAKKVSPTKQREHDKEELISSIKSLLETQSAFRSHGTVEGVVLRQDSREWMIRKFKVVRPDFVAGCAGGHWSRRAIEKQIIDYCFAMTYLEQCYVFAGEASPESSALPLSDLNSSKQPHKKNKKTNSKAETSHFEMMKSRRRRAPRCIVLMGLPASGKSTFSQQLKTTFDRDDQSRAGTSTTLIANQDSLGRRECEKKASRASAKVRVIVDRCNATEAERREWVKCMHSPSPSDLALIYFATPVEKCIQRVGLRLNHKLPSSSNAGRIVRDVAARMEPPTEEERRRVFGRVEVVSTWYEAEALLCQLGVSDEDTYSEQ